MPLCFCPAASGQGLDQLFHFQGLGQVGVHARLQTLFRVLVKGVGRHGQDGDGLGVGAETVFSSGAGAISKGMVMTKVEPTPT